MGATISSSNAVYLLSIARLYPSPVQIQAFSTDDAFDTDTVTISQIEMGVDGRMSSGFVPFVTSQTIVLQANSPSIDVFENWIEAMKTARDTMPANATISIPSIGKKYDLTNGVLVSIHQISSVKKVLAPRSFTLAWENVSPAVQ